MEHFRKLMSALQVEKEEDRRSYALATARLSVSERRENGMTWYPVAIKDTEIGRGDYLTAEIERTTHQDLGHQFRFGMTVALFSNHSPSEDRVEGIISHLSGNRLKISFRFEDLPDWTRNGKLGVDVVFDENSYTEMETALRLAPVIAEKREEGTLIRTLLGTAAATFNEAIHSSPVPTLNAKQNEAVAKIVQANSLAIVHGPPGTGKTTTLVQAIRLLVATTQQQVLVTAPSNAAVDLLTERLSDAGLNVVRIGNPARVNERQMNLTLDARITAHPSAKEVRRLRKQASEYRDLAHKYKRSFGPAEREQRKALFAEARNLSQEVERTEQYITNDILERAQVITSTLVGANHYTIRSRRFETIVIDEAAQALEAACWIPILKAGRVILAGDHNQLPPTIKSPEAAKTLRVTLMEQLVALHPDTVVLLQEQYRMHDAIMNFPSQMFYDHSLIAHSSVATATLREDDAPFLFIDTAGCGFEEKQDGNGMSNPEEASFVVSHLNSLVDRLIQHYEVTDYPTIGIIAPYRHQVELLKQLVLKDTMFKTYANFTTVNTVDSFQGQERDVIYISLTRSNADNNIGFLSEIRRMNVAMTRARKKLVMIGDSSTLGQYSFYDRLIQYAQSVDCYKSAWEFME